MDINGVRNGSRVVAPKSFEQVRAREYAPWLAHKLLEQSEFRQRERQLVRTLEDGQALPVENKVAEIEAVRFPST